MDEEIVKRELEAAEGTLEVKQETGVEPSPEDKPIYKKSEKKAGKRIGYYYIIVKSLKESRKNDVVKCFYIKSLTKWGFCVIKEGTYGESKDKEGRDIKDRLLWQKELHEKLQDKVRMPRYLDSFEENGNYYLVMEYLRGKPLYKVLKESDDMWSQVDAGTKVIKKTLKHILQVIDILQKMHDNKVVHRDATANNFMLLPLGGMAVIDMELSYPLDASFLSPPFQLGTQGYMSPEQQATMVPTEKEDVYALGALMLQLLTAVSPSKLTGGQEDMRDKIGYLIKDAGMAGIIYRALATEAYERPLLSEISVVVKDYLTAIKRNKKRPLSNSKLCSAEEIREAVQSGIDALSTPIFCDAERGWFAENMRPEIDVREKFQRSWYASYNRGASGILFFLSRAKGLGYDVSGNEHAVDMSMRLISKKYADRPERAMPGLHFGSDGIAVCLGEAIRSGLLAPEPHYSEWMGRFLEKKTAYTSIYQGSAGQGIANMLCADMLGDNGCYARMQEYVDDFLNIQQPKGIWGKAISKQDEKFVIKGFGNGHAGIVYFLSKYALSYQSLAAGESALKGLKWLSDTVCDRGGYFGWTSAKGRKLGHSWSDGNAGIALAFMKAYELTADKSFSTFARRILHQFPSEILLNKFSILTGLAGLGHIYLEAARVLGDVEWSRRASGIANTLLRLKRISKDGHCYWLVEQERQPVANLMVGNSGVLDFLMHSQGEGSIKGEVLPF